MYNYLHKLFQRTEKEWIINNSFSESIMLITNPDKDITTNGQSFSWTETQNIKTANTFKRSWISFQDCKLGFTFENQYYTLPH